VGTRPDGEETGIIFAFLTRIRFLAEMFHVDDLVFAWDSKRSLRKETSTWYKADRNNKELIPDEDWEDLQCMYRQMNQLHDILPRIGLTNVVGQDGCEADDIIARICFDSLLKITIVSADADLFQLLMPHVRMYNPHTRKWMDGQKLREEKGCTWKQWWKVKAIAGCSGDEVPGINGVGEKTAIQFLNGELPKHYKKYQMIVSEEGRERIRLNGPLVRLPLPQTEPVKLGRCKFDPDAFLEVCDEYNLSGLALKVDLWEQTFRT